jgi:hypothetical protein
MRLVAAPDGAVDRYDRAIWLTLPFDLLWTSIDYRACLTLTDALAFTLTTTDAATFTLTVADTDACNA